MTANPSGGYRRAVAAFLLLFALFLIIVDVLIVNNQHRVIIDKEREHFKVDVNIAGILLREPLLRHNYDEAEQFLLQWGEEKDEVLEVKAVMPNGFLLAHYRSALPQVNTHTILKQVDYLGRDLIRLEVVMDLANVKSILKRLQLQLITGSLLLTSLFAIVLWVVMKKIAIDPLKKEVDRRRAAEEKLQESRDNLQLAVKERTRELDVSNQNMLQQNIQLRENRDAMLNLVEDLESSMSDLEDKKANLEDTKARLQALNIDLNSTNKELESIFFAASHDLRTPLVNIQGFGKELQCTINDLLSELQKMEVPLRINKKIFPLIEKDIPEALGFIYRGTVKMEALLNALLQVSRIGRFELDQEHVDMNTLISDVIKNLEFRLKENNVKTEVADLPSCIADSIQIHQVFTNLIENAIKYRDPERACIIRIIGHREKGRDIYCVEDNGIGIAPEYREQIFKLFHRLEPDKSTGEGLGLTIVRKIVEKHHGEIWVESEAGAGSKFFVALPQKTGNRE